MAMLAPLVGEIVGVERAAIEIRDDGLLHSVRVGDAIDFEVQDIVPFGKEDGEPVRFAGMFHPAGSELTMAEARHSRINAFGIAVRGEDGPLDRRVLLGCLTHGRPGAGTPSPSDGLAPAFAAVRVRFGLVALLFALAGLGWWWTVRQMAGMDEGPWTGLGSLTWFLGVWVTMMAAMMFPSVAPTVALYSRMTYQRSRLPPPLFVAGYLLTWTAAGLVAFVLAAGLGHFWGDVLAWDRAGRWVAGTVLLAAAAYELTPLKDVCSAGAAARSAPSSARGEGSWGSLRMGATNGAWCVGCCWALMASLFALGVMSVVWMAVVAGLIAVEKTLPWRRVATYGTAALLLALGVLLLAAPQALPALSVPGDAPMNEEPMDGMDPMGSRARLVSCSGRGSRSRPAGTGPRGCRGRAPRRRPRR